MRRDRLSGINNSTINREIIAELEFHRISHEGVSDNVQFFVELAGRGIIRGESCDATLTYRIAKTMLSGATKAMCKTRAGTHVRASLSFPTRPRLHPHGRMRVIKNDRPRAGLKASTPLKALTTLNRPPVALFVSQRAEFSAPLQDL